MARRSKTSRRQILDEFKEHVSRYGIGSTLFARNHPETFHPSTLYYWAKEEGIEMPPTTADYNQYTVKGRERKYRTAMKADGTPFRDRPRNVKRGKKSRKKRLLKKAVAPKLTGPGATVSKPAAKKVKKVAKKKAIPNKIYSPSGGPTNLGSPKLEDIMSPEDIRVLRMASVAAGMPIWVFATQAIREACHKTVQEAMAFSQGDPQD